MDKVSMVVGMPLISSMYVTADIFTQHITA